MVESRIDHPWRARLHERFRGSPAPLFVFAGGVVPAASIWAGTRVWVQAFRRIGLRPGDRILCGVPASSCFLHLLLATLWEGYTLVLLCPGEPCNERQLALFDAALGVTTEPEPEAFWLTPDPAGLVTDESLEGFVARPGRGPPTPEARLLARTSGTRSAGRWAAISDQNLLSVLSTHEPALGYGRESRVLSVLPWHHLFGLVVELMPAMFAGADIIRDPESGRNPQSILGIAAEHGVTHLSAVPLTLARVLELPRGGGFLRGLEGGVVGGAPISAWLASKLRSTLLRVGYGQTEASPAIALGEPGDLRPGGIGRPLGCETRIDPDGVLAFRGRNRCLGFWEHGRLVCDSLTQDGWHRTEDVVETLQDGSLRFLCRADDGFKMDNGRMVDAGRFEERLLSTDPGVRSCWLWSPTGRDLSLWFVPARTEHMPDPMTLADVAGPLLPMLREVRSVPADTLLLNAKGCLDRRGLLVRHRDCPIA